MSWHRSPAALAWSAVLLLALLFCAWRVAGGGAFESNILGLMPDSATESDLARLAGGRFDKAFVVLLSHSDKDTAADLASQLLGQLSARPGVAIASNDADPITLLGEFFAPYRHQLLSPDTRRALQNNDPEALAGELLRELYSPVPSPRLYSLAEDPFNLGGQWLQSLFAGAGQFGAGEQPSLRHKGQTWQLLQGELTRSSFDPSAQQAVADTVTAFAAANPEAQLLRSGVVFHAAEATTIARREISTLGTASLLGIVLLVTLVFRSRQALAAIGFTLVSSTLVALAVTLAVFDRVHLVTLAFGSTLLGLAVDYCFHFLVKYQTVGDSRATGRLIRRGVLLSAGSSITAYLIQLWSPLPGLQQFAVFMATGLLGACAAVTVLTLNYRAPPSSPLENYTRLYPRYLAPLYRRATAHRWPWLLALLVALPVLGMWVAGQGSRDDIRLLNTSSEALLNSEGRVQMMLGGVDSQRYWRVEGSGQQQVLMRMEQLAALLAQEQLDTATMAAIQMVPSLDQQRRDHALVSDKLYGPDGALSRVCTHLASDCRQWRTLPGDFRDDLTPTRVPAEVAALFPALHLIDENLGLVLLRQGTEIPDPVTHAIAGLPGVSPVDQVAELSARLGVFRTEVVVLLAIFITLFILGSLMAFGRRGLPVATAVLVSVIVSLASSAADGVTLFHALALLLVLGLSVDTAVFYLELGLNGETWLAATLATATSILAFGLLSLSQVPVLHYFGGVVFAGLLCSWLVTPLLFNLWGVQPPGTDASSTGRNP